MLHHGAQSVLLHHFFFYLFICSHNDSIQCVAYNPVTHQLASCSSGDFGECTLVENFDKCDLM